MVEEPVLRVALLAAGASLIPAIAVARWVGLWSRSITVAVVQSRLSAWYAVLARLRRRLLKPPAASPQLGDRAHSTAGSGVPLDRPDPAVHHHPPVWPVDDPDYTTHIGPTVRPYADPTWKPAWQRQKDRHALRDRP